MNLPSLTNIGLDFSSLFSVLNVPYVLFSVLVAFVTVWLAKRVSVMVEEAWSRNEAHRSTAHFVARFTMISLLVIGFGLALRISGFDASVFLGAITFAAGYALRGWLSNLMAGTILASFLDLGTFVKLGKDMGGILEIGAASTLLKTLTNQTVRIPNASLVTQQLTVMGQYTERLFQYYIWLWREAAPLNAIATLEKVLGAEEAFIQTPEPPMVLLVDFTGGYQLFRIRAWFNKGSVKNLITFKAKLKRKLVASREKHSMPQPYNVTTLTVNAHDSDDALAALRTRLAPAR